MKKNYKAPKVRMVILDEAESVIATSNQSPSLSITDTEADGGYTGGGDSKLLNIVNMGDDEAMTWE